MSARLHPEPIAATVGCFAVAAALAIIWVSRLGVGREMYVSELGAVGEPTAHWFEAALLLIVGGGSLIAWAGRRVRSSSGILAAWTPAVSLWIGCGFFFVASQVTCTTGCPLPVGATFTLQDLTHTAAAVLAFTAACLAMIQAALAREHLVLSRISLASGILVATIAGSGGLMSLVGFEQVLGSRLELLATTVAVVWLAAFGAILARRRNPERSAGHEIQQSVG